MSDITPGKIDILEYDYKLAKAAYSSWPRAVELAQGDGGVQYKMHKTDKRNPKEVQRILDELLEKNKLDTYIKEITEGIKKLKETDLNQNEKEKLYKEVQAKLFEYKKKGSAIYKAIKSAIGTAPVNRLDPTVQPNSYVKNYITNGTVPANYSSPEINDLLDSYRISVGMWKQAEAGSMKDVGVSEEDKRRKAYGIIAELRLEDGTSLKKSIEKLSVLIHEKLDKARQSKDMDPKERADLIASTKEYIKRHITLSNRARAAVNTVSSSQATANTDTTSSTNTMSNSASAAMTTRYEQSRSQSKKISDSVLPSTSSSVTSSTSPHSSPKDNGGNRI